LGISDDINDTRGSQILNSESKFELGPALELAEDQEEEAVVVDSSLYSSR